MYMKKLKSYNLNTEFCRLRRELIWGPKVLNALRVIVSDKAVFVILSFLRKQNAKIILFSYDYRQKDAAVHISWECTKSGLLCLPVQK